MDLTRTQIRHLRGLCHRLDPVVMVADKGLTDNVRAEVELALDSHELIKVKLRGDREQRNAWGRGPGLVDRRGPGPADRPGRLPLSPPSREPANPTAPLIVLAMQLSEHRPDGQYFIHSLTDDAIRIVDTPWRESLLLSPVQAPEAWPVTDVGAVDRDAIAPILAQRPDVVLLASGRTLTFPPRDTRAPFSRPASDSR